MLRTLFWAFSIGIGSLFAANGPDVGLHPGYDLVNIRPTGFEPKVCGLEFLPNGDLLVLTWRGTTGPAGTSPAGIPTVSSYTGTTKLYRMSGVKGKDASAIKVTEVASGLFKDAHGLVVVDGSVYVGDIDRVVKMVDADGDGKYEAVKEIGKFPAYQGWFEYSFGPVHKNGKLFMALAGGVSHGGYPIAQGGPGRSTVLSVPITGGSYSMVAEGLRAPNGIAIGPDNEIFVTDNQGGWRPASPFFHVKQGAFYGYHGDPAGPMELAAKEVPVAPVLWGPYREANESPTEPCFVKSGTYAGQFIVGDISRGGIYRFFMEKVKGEYQGGLIPFSGGLEVGIDRIRIDEQGQIFVGGLGTGSQSNQGWSGTTFGLQKLVPNGKPVFEILAVHSRAAGLEIEFTQPVADAAAKAAAYAVRQWGYTPTAEYGGPKVGDHALTVSSAQISPDRKSVFLAIPNLTTGQVAGITLTGVTAADGKALFFNKVWYTLNAISESAPFSPTTRVRSQGSARAAVGSLRTDVTQGLRLDLPAGDYRVELTDLAGKGISLREHASGRVDIPTGATGRGVGLLRVDGQGRKWTQTVVLP